MDCATNICYTSGSVFIEMTFASNTKQTAFFVTLNRINSINAVFGQSVPRHATSFFSDSPVPNLRHCEFVDLFPTSLGQVCPNNGSTIKQVKKLA